MSGYIKIHRALFDHPVVGFHVPAPRAANGKRPVPPFMAWEWLCAKAAFRPHQVNNKGRVETLERGQLLAARAHLASEWGWTEQNVRTFLKNLHAHHMVEINQSAGHYTAVLTVCNYGVYQGEAAEDNQSTNQSLTRESPETNHTERREELKKEKKEDISLETEPCLFEADNDASDQTDEVREAFDAYNATAAECGLPKAVKLSAARRAKIRARLDDYGLDGWKQALENIEKSSFLTGGTSHKFLADLDFICQPKSFDKCHDGGYGNGRHRQKSREGMERYFDKFAGEWVYYPSNSTEAAA